MNKIALTLLVSAFAFPAFATETYELNLKDHKFSPEVITVPADTRFKIKVHNQDSTPAEFESNDFKREKIIAGNTSATIHVSPLPAGEYTFFDEFNEDTAQGILKVE